MAVVPEEAQEASKSATVVRSDSAVGIVLAKKVLFGTEGDPFERTSFAGEVEHAVDIGLTALRSVDGRAEVDGCAPDGGGGGEGCESGDGEGGELHFGGCGCWGGGWLAGELVGLRSVGLVGRCELMC